MMSKLFLLSIIICLYAAVSSTLGAPHTEASASLVGIDRDGNAVQIGLEQGLEEEGDGNGNGASVAPVSEQARIDTLLRVFRLLPPSELDSYLPESATVVNGNSQILPGSPEATALFNAWDQRQKDLAAAVNSMVKPVEHMASIMQKLRDSSVVDSDMISLLKELESNVGDVDNARDFHTIGGWPLLGQLLDDKERTPKVRGYAAWIVGTAVSNNYDYQLWTLENCPSTIVNADDVNSDSLKVCTFDSLLRALHNPFPGNEYSEDVDFLHKKAIYALSASVRGNPDVQAHASSNTNLVPTINGFLKVFADERVDGLNHTYALEMSRKIWGLVSDLLTERYYIHNELLQDVMDQNSRMLVNKTVEAIAELNQQNILNHTKIIEDLHMLGDEFSNADTLEFAVSALQNLLYNSDYLISVKGNTASRTWWMSQLNSVSSSKHKVAIRNLVESLLSSISYVMHEDTKLITSHRSLISLVAAQMKTLDTLLVDSEPNTSIRQLCQSISGIIKSHY